MKEKEKGTSTRKSRKNKDFILLSEKDLKHTRLIDDIIFKIVIEKRKEVGEEILRIALGKDLSLEESSSQKNIASLAGKSIILDYFAKEEDGALYNLEIQTRRTKDLIERTLTYFSILITSMAEKGKLYHSVLGVNVIFLCNFDPFRKGKPIYTVLHLENKGKTFRIIFLNAKYKGEDEFGRLYADMLKTDYNTIKNPVIREAMTEVITPMIEGRKLTMSGITERYYNYGFKDGERRGLKDGKEIGKEIGAKQSKVEFARSLLSTGEFSAERVAELIGLPLKEVKAIESELKEA